MNLLRLENPAEISPEVRYYSLERLTEEKSRIGKYIFLSCPDIPLSCCETYEPIVVVSRIRVSLVWTCDTLKNNFGVRHKFAKYLEENCSTVLRNISPSKIS